MGRPHPALWKFRSLPPDPSPSTKAKQVLAALLRIGWRIKRQGGSSHRIPERTGWLDVLFAYLDKVTPGATALQVLAKKTGLTPKDL
jgi:hypothetical protein